MATREDVLRVREDAVLDRERVVAQIREANEQLVLATVRADEQSDRATTSVRVRDDFMAMLGHELRNPLSPILTTLELMEMREPATFRNERNLIARQVHHMVRLVDDLLDISRITGGKIQLHRARVDLTDIVASAVEMVGPLLGAKRHALTVDLMPNLVVDGDPTRLAQVMTNLIANAAKYTPEGGKIEVTGTRRGSCAVLTVRDNGIGISAEMLPRVFDLFAQDRQALARSEGGLGLGLAIVERLVALHGGSVTARSAGRGCGSELVVELPVASAQVATAPVDSLRISVISRRILVVDDNHDTADLTGQILGLLGHEIRVAYDGPSALAVVATFVPEIAFLDLGLPGMDGYALARALREAHPKLRLVAVTGYGQPEDRERTRQAGFDVHLVKPVDVATLRATVNG